VLEPGGFYYPNRIARSFFVAMEDVMGQHGLSTLLNLADMEAYIDNPPPDNLERQFDFAAVAALNQALEDMYGARGGRGMALRIGRASFSYGLKHFGLLRGMSDPVFRALPIDKQVAYGLHGLAAVFSNFSDQASRISEADDGDSHYFITQSPFAFGRTADRPVCHMMVGLLQEGLRWATNGYEFYVREQTCLATGGDECVFRINKHAIGQQPHTGML
jgi:predicted hydrocarbon binding protein